MYKFNEGCTKFCERHTKFFEGCTKGSKVRSEVRMGPNHFLIGSKMKSWTIHVQMGVLEVIGSDVPNLVKNIPNFVKSVPNP